jgi:hypothetical protein
VLGSFAPGQHTVAVNFLNDLYGGTATTDRNLYVEAASYDGVAVAGGQPLLALLSTEGKAFTVNDTTAIGTPPPPAGSDIALAAIGSGSDTLKLRITQDAYLGNALFTVSIDGQQIGGTQTVSASALHGSNTANTLDVLGNFAPGQHTVGINFLNDAWGGTPDTDRNLYVEAASYDGAAIAGGPPLLTLLSTESRAFTVSDFTVIA